MTAAQKPIAHRSGSVMSINSRSFHRIAYQDWGEEDSADTIFCLHGLTRNSHDFDAIARRMAETRRVICPDMAGRGKSDWLPDHQDYQIPQYNVDLMMTRASVGCPRFDILGTSLGGMMGMILAAMRNTQVRRLIINDVAPEAPHTAMARLSRYLHLDPVFDSLNDLEQHLRETLAPFHPMTDRDWKNTARTSSRKVKGGYKLAFDPDISNTYQRKYWYMMYFNLWKYWVRIRCPVLILRGRESDFLTEHLLDRMLKKLPHAEVIEFDRAGHTPTLNAPEQIDPVLAWLERTPAV